MTDLITAAIEWRDARQSIFDAQSVLPTKEQWSRLADAEHQLMTAARALGGVKTETWHPIVGQMHDTASTGTIIWDGEQWLLISSQEAQELMQRLAGETEATRLQDAEFS